MLIRFWGTRGSLPSPITGARVQEKIRAALAKTIGRPIRDEADLDSFLANECSFAERSHFGGNTSCVEIDIGEDNTFICDFGTGVRELGNLAIATHGPSAPRTYHVLLSHLHWDHMMGFPFFIPAYIPGNRIVIHGCHKNMRAAFETQHSLPGFPVPFKALGATIEFDVMEPGQTYDIAGAKVRPMAQIHAGDSYGYRVEHGGKVFVYSTDSEHPLERDDLMAPFEELFHKADLVVFDAMYTFAEAVSIKKDWGHSSNVIGIDLAQRAQAKRLALFHHEPNSDDAAILSIEAESRRFEQLTREGRHAVEILSAYDGLEIRL
ncbi:MAG: MBL fold metallo-hydrolase [Elsteraceae bacterium]